MKSKKRIIIILIIIILISIIYYNNKNKNNDNIKKLIYNHNKSFTKEQVKEGVTFKNIKCYYNGKDSMISYIITNQTNETINLKNYKVLVKDKKGMVITNIFIDFDRKIAPKEEIKYKNSVTDADLSNAYSMELRLEKNNK